MMLLRWLLIGRIQLVVATPLIEEALWEDQQYFPCVERKTSASRYDHRTLKDHSNRPVDLSYFFAMPLRILELNFQAQG